MPAFDPNAIPAGGGVLDVRPRNEVERKAEAAARREFQARLEKVLRREVQETIARELSDLRAEVAALRSELVEKVGGQLRLERIETTRLIGSDLEALQQQVRELRVLQSGDDATAAALDALTIEDDVTDVEAIEDEGRRAPRRDDRAPTATRGPARPVEAERCRGRACGGRACGGRACGGRACGGGAGGGRAGGGRACGGRAGRRPSGSKRNAPRAERAEAERAEAERVEAERVEAERAEAERVEAERAEAERAEAERVEAERAEAERVEAERAEAERAEAERVEAEQVHAAHRMGGFDGDPFASMPRLTPFTDFEPVAETPVEQGAPHEDTVAGHESETSRRGRRYREDDSEDNILARILQRERTQ